MPVETTEDDVATLATETATTPTPKKPHRRLRTVGAYVALTAGAVVVLFPIYITIVNSLLAPDQLVQQPPPLVPTNPQWHNYSAAWNGGQMSKYMATSAIMTATIVVGQLLTSILAAYAFAFLRFPLKRTLFVLCLATLMIPLEVTFITNLSTITSLHWFNSYEGLSIPFLATGFGIFLLRQAFLQIPRDLQEAAQLDGYGHLRFMTRVAVPLARPSLAALAVFSFLGAVEPVPLAAGVDGRHDTARHRADRLETASRDAGLVAPRLTGRGRHRVRAAGHPADHLPEATCAQPDRGRRQVGGGRRLARPGARQFACGPPTSFVSSPRPWS